jgi:hypothetical protein
MHRQIIYACLFLQLLAFTSYAQQSPQHHISYSDPSGYTTVGNRWIKRHAAKEADRHGDNAGASFTMNGHELQAFPQWLDSIWDEAVAEFGKCYDVSRLSPGMLHIQIEDAPFGVTDLTGRTVMASGTTDQNGNIRVVYWNWRNDIGGQHAVDLARGETRNWMYWRLTNQPKELWGIEVCK